MKGKEIIKIGIMLKTLLKKYKFPLKVSNEKLKQY